jgi:hypothetical protein
MVENNFCRMNVAHQNRAHKISRKHLIAGGINELCSNLWLMVAIYHEAPIL